MPVAAAPVSAQVTVATTATALCATKASRKRLTVVNHGTTAVYIGPLGVTTTTGILLAGVVGQKLDFVTPGILYGIVASGTQIVSIMEEY